MSRYELHIRSLFFDENGSGEKMETRTEAAFSEEKEGWFLSYADEENGLPKTDLFIKKGTPCVVKMQNAQSELLFSVGRTYKTLYRIPGVGELDFTVTTQRAEAELSSAGGSLRLDYEAVIGGARRRAVMRLTLTRKEAT